MEPLHFEDHDVVKQRARLSFPQPRGVLLGPGEVVERPTESCHLEIWSHLLVGKLLDYIYIYVYIYPP